MVRDTPRSRPARQGSLESGQRSGSAGRAARNVGDGGLRFLSRNEATPYLALCIAMLLFLFLFTSHKAQPRIEGGGASGSKSSVPLSYGGVKQHQGDVKNGIGQDHHWGVGESGGDRVDPEWDSGSSESGRDKLTQQTSMSTGGEHASSLSVERNANRLDHNEHRIDAMTSQVSDMGSKIESLEHDLAVSKCDAFLGGMTRDNDHSGLCRVSKGSFKNIVFSTGSGASSASTKSSARPRATDYNVDNKRWLNAVDHWKEVSHTFPTPSHKTFSFSVNTHNPVTEDATISAAIQNDEAYRWPILDLFSRKLQNVPESLVVDVGANIGYFTLWAAAMGHRVVSFEPIDFNLRYLLTSINKNDFADKVTIYQNAVSNAGGKLVPDVTDKLNKGNIGLREGSARGMYGMDYVDALKLDDIVDEEVLLLRIDAGGYEFKALDGARKLICNNIVRNIVFEFQKSRLKDSDCSGLGVACWLHSLGYKITPLDGTEHLMPQGFREYPDTVVATLDEPALPPSLALDIKGELNPCSSFAQLRSSEKWAGHKTAWCAKTLQDLKDTLRPCVDWGELKVLDRDVWKAIGCDELLGFECSTKQLDEGKLQSAAGDQAWVSEWSKSALEKTYSPHDDLRDSDLDASKQDSF